jgi:spore maturation protein CgeB
LKKALYIGQYSHGTTSKMRADILRELLPEHEMKVIDINLPYNKSNRLLKSFTFRYKVGPLVNSINKYIIQNAQNTYDLIWVDKAVYIKPGTTKWLRKKTKRLIHFTPDPAFLFHRSRNFFGSLHYYDFAITTKSYEVESYSAYIDQKQIILTTQGFHKGIHKPVIPFSQKKTAVLFIGHYEKDRGEMINALNAADISVTLAGKGWKRFIKSNSKLDQLTYLGEGIYGNEYARVISEHQMALGLLSKWIPEQHTTRTFEIPACGTALITEENDETRSFFEEDEVIFYSALDDLIYKIKDLIRKPEEVKRISEKGYENIMSSGFDYESILRRLLLQIQ